MKVKAGNKIYDSNKQPVMVILSKQDKENIKNMLPECTKYCVYPDKKEFLENDSVVITKWMSEEK